MAGVDDLVADMRQAADALERTAPILSDHPEQFEHVLLVMALRDALRALAEGLTGTSQKINGVLPEEYRE